MCVGVSVCRGETANQWNKCQGAYLTFIPVLLLGSVSGSHILQTPVRENLKSREVVVVVTRRLKMKHFQARGERGRIKENILKGRVRARN